MFFFSSSYILYMIPAFILVMRGVTVGSYPAFIEKDYPLRRAGGDKIISILNPQYRPAYPHGLVVDVSAISSKAIDSVGNSVGPHLSTNTGRASI